MEAWIVLPGSGIVPHVYSSPPRSQPMGRCTADIPGPPPQASSSSSSLYGLETDRNLILVFDSRGEDLTEDLRNMSDHNRCNKVTLIFKAPLKE